jgi:PIN domain nuclease of toxin-antitoxin system
VSAVVADTRTILWYLSDDPQLSVRASEALDKSTGEGEPIFIPTICVVEVTYLIEKNRIEPLAMARLELAVNQSGSAFLPAPLTAEIAFLLSEIPRSSRPDLPDRVVAATALTLGLPLVTRVLRVGIHISCGWLCSEGQLPANLAFRSIAPIMG